MKKYDNDYNKRLMIAIMKYAIKAIPSDAETKAISEIATISTSPWVSSDALFSVSDEINPAKELFIRLN